MRFVAACTLAFLVAVTAALGAASDPAAELGREAVFLEERIRVGDTSLAELREAQVRIAALGRLAGRDVSKLVEAIATARDGLHAWRHPDCAAVRAASRFGSVQGSDSPQMCERLLRPVFGRAGLPAPSAEALLAGADLKPLLNAVFRRNQELLQALGIPSATGPVIRPTGRPD